MAKQKQVSLSFKERGDWKELPISHLKEQFLKTQTWPSRHFIRKLASDPRSGVKQLAHWIERKQIKEEEEIVQIEQLLAFEKILWARSLRCVAGVDEVGLGAIAGPVIAAAVVVPPELDLRVVRGVNDSKQLTPTERARLAPRIRAEALAIGIGRVDVDEIARLNIFNAGLEAMRRAVKDLTVEVEHVLIDGRAVAGLDIPQNCFIKGDTLNFSIAAASIVAKVHRDSLMEEYDSVFPQYGFKSHKGYGTKAHWRALRRYGPSSIHRQSYETVKAVKRDLDKQYEAELVS